MHKKLIVLFLIFSTLLFAQDKRKIGLIPFTNESGNSKFDWVSYGIDYYLHSKLSVLAGFYIPDNESFKKALDKAGFPGKKIDERMIYHIGRYSGVEVTVSGSYKMSGNTIILEVAFSNAFNGSVLLTSKFNEPLSNLFRIGRKIADQLINLAGITVTSTEVRMLDFTLTNSIKAYESFIRAYMENEKENRRVEVVTGLFRQAIREDAKFWEAYYNLGIVYFNSRSYGPALEQFNKVISVLPNFDKPYFGRGLIYEKQKKYQKAIQDFKMVNKFNPNDYKPFYYLGKISILDKDYKEAEKYLTKAIEINPDYAPSYYQMGNIYYNQDIFRKSINFYKKAVALDEKNANYHLKLGDTFYRSQIFYSALTELNTALSINPSNPIAYFLRGITIYKQAVLEELVNAFLDILSDTSVKPKKVKEKRFKKDKAIDPVTKRQVYVDMAESFSNAVKLRPRFMEATFNLALTYHEMGDLKKAEKFYLRTIQLKPRLIRAHLKLAELYTETDRKKQGLEQYRRIFHIEPAIFVNHPTLGAEYNYIDVLKKFRAEVEKQLKRQPNHPGNNLLLARLFEAQGQYGKAANLARKVLSVSPGNAQAKALLKKIQR